MADEEEWASYPGILQNGLLDAITIGHSLPRATTRRGEEAVADKGQGRRRDKHAWSPHTHPNDYKN